MLKADSSAVHFAHCYILHTVFPSGVFDKQALEIHFLKKIIFYRFYIWQGRNISWIYADVAALRNPQDAQISAHL